MNKSCSHKFKFLHSSTFMKDNILYTVDRYVCSICEKNYSIDIDTGKRINLQGLIGEES